MPRPLILRVLSPVIMYHAHTADRVTVLLDSSLRCHFSPLLYTLPLHAAKPTLRTQKGGVTVSRMGLVKAEEKVMEEEEEEEEEVGGGHGTLYFVTLFMVAAVVVMVGYLAVHNRKKVRHFTDISLFHHPFSRATDVRVLLDVITQHCVYISLPH